MPAIKSNFLVLYKNNAQVYSTGSKDIALASPPPEGYTVEDKRILFITHQPETGEVIVSPVPLEEIRTAEIIQPKTKKEFRDARKNAERKD